MTISDLTQKVNSQEPYLTDHALIAKAIQLMLGLPVSALYHNGLFSSQQEHYRIYAMNEMSRILQKNPDSFSDILTEIEAYPCKNSYEFGSLMLMLANLCKGFAPKRKE